MIAHRKAVERQYRGKMWVSEMEDAEIDGEDLQEPKEVLTDLPCYLQRSQIKVANPTESHSAVAYNLKLIYAPGIQIKAGSRVKVMQDGIIMEFKHSGEAFPYPTHNEIIINRGDFV